MWTLDGGVGPATGEAHLSACYDYLARLTIHRDAEHQTFRSPAVESAERVLVGYPIGVQRRVQGDWDSVFEIPLPDTTPAESLARGTQ